MNDPVVRPSSAGAAPRMLDDPRYRAFHIAAIVAIPLVQLLINPAVFVNPSQTIDAWVYTGFFLSLPSHLRHFGDTYYATRLAWLLPGFAAHRLLPPLAASYALHVTFFYALLFATYRLLASGATRHTAMLGTLLMAWSPGILAAIGWDYVDGAGIVFLMTTLLCLERAVSGRRHVAWSMAAGAAAACLVVTNLTLVALLPACGLFLLLRAGVDRVRFILVTVVASALGATAMLVIFGGLNRLLGGRWLFLEPSLRFAMAVYGGPNPWKPKVFSWIRAYWLAVPVFATVGAMASVLAPPRGERTFARAVQATLLAGVAAWVLSDLFANSALLRDFFYVSYLVPLALIALPLQGEVAVPADRLRTVVGIELAALAALAVVHAVFLWHAVLFERVAGALSATRPVHPVALQLVSCIALTAGGLAVVLVRTIPRPTTRSLLFAVAMALSFITPHYWPNAGTANPPREFETTALAHRFITSHVGNRAVRFWYQLPQGTAPPFQAIACTYLWGWVLVNEQMPHLTRSEADGLKPDTQIVLLIARPAEMVEARASLRQFGLDYAVTAEERFDTNGRIFSVLIANLSRAEPE